MTNDKLMSKIEVRKRVHEHFRHSLFKFHSSFVIRHFGDGKLPIDFRAVEITWSALPGHRRLRRRASRPSGSHLDLRPTRPGGERNTCRGHIRSTSGKGVAAKNRASFAHCYPPQDRFDSRPGHGASSNHHV